MKARNVVDWDEPDHNMYGCAPCPKCAGKFRASYRRAEALSIECECGHTELAAPPGAAPCAERYEVGDGTVDRCALEKGHDGWHRATLHKRSAGTGHNNEGESK